jgi:hypothetical protein
VERLGPADIVQAALDPVGTRQAERTPVALEQREEEVQRPGPAVGEEELAFQVRRLAPWDLPVARGEALAACLGRALLAIPIAKGRWRGTQLRGASGP